MAEVFLGQGKCTVEWIPMMSNMVAYKIIPSMKHAS
jgi:hypothetical protein